MKRCCFSIVWRRVHVTLTLIKTWSNEDGLLVDSYPSQAALLHPEEQKMASVPSKTSEELRRGPLASETSVVYLLLYSICSMAQLPLARLQFEGPQPGVSPSLATPLQILSVNSVLPTIEFTNWSRIWGVVNHCKNERIIPENRWALGRVGKKDTVSQIGIFFPHQWGILIPFWETVF